MQTALPHKATTGEITHHYLVEGDVYTPDQLVDFVGTLSYYDAMDGEAGEITNVKDALKYLRQNAYQVEIMKKGGKVMAKGGEVLSLLEIAGKLEELGQDADAQILRDVYNGKSDISKIYDIADNAKDADETDIYNALMDVIKERDDESEEWQMAERLNQGEMADGGEAESLVGKRIKMILMPNDPRPIAFGEMGTIRSVDGIGQLQVKWDSGRTLAVIPEEDKYEIMADGGGLGDDYFSKHANGEVDIATLEAHFGGNVPYPTCVINGKTYEKCFMRRKYKLK